MSRAGTILAAVVGALALAAMVFGTRWAGTHASGRARTAHFLDDATKVVIVDERTTRDSRVVRVRVHDARSGAELVRERLRSRSNDAANAARQTCFDCIPASRDRLWCCERTGDDGLSLRRLDSLAVVADEARLHHVAPGLAQGLSREIGGLKPMVDLDDGALLVTGKAGWLYRIGADLSARVETPRTYDKTNPDAFAKWATNTMHMDNLALPAHAVPFERGSGLIHSARVAGRTLRLQPPSIGSQRRLITVTIAKESGEPETEAPHPSETFLDAGFLADPDWGEFKPVLLDDAQALVLAHYELASGGRQLILTRVDKKGGLGWSRRLDDDQVRGARLSGDVLVVVLRDALVGLDPATGTVRYRQPF